MKIHEYLLILLTFLMLGSCKKYLDVKPDKALVVPQSLEDCEALLGQFSIMNSNYPVDGETSADNYYLNTESYNGFLYFQEDKDAYIWATNGQRLSSYWSEPYRVVLQSNIILETLNKISPTASQQIKWNSLRGSALFFRAFAFYQLAQVYAKPYSLNASETDLGIPLRLSSDFNEKTKRSTLKQTYEQILSDYQAASQLLPSTTSIKSQPNKAAGFAGLARTYLAMEDYRNAGAFADLSLKSYNTLIDFNILDSTSNSPFSIFNDEVTFQSKAATTDLLDPYESKIDPDLIASYHSNDLRRVVFFKKNSDGTTYQFKGNYNGNISSQFNGFAVDEMYLVRSECYARSGNTSEALKDLNSLLITRWKRDKFVPFNAPSVNAALSLILNERRKELVFRFLRWTDLRRLNKDQNFAKNLTRTVNNQTYELPPNDLRYTILVPQSIIDQTGISQNER